MINYDALSLAASKKVISGYLKAPASATFSEHRITDRRDDYIQAETVVDSANAMGVKVRSRWCTVVKLSGPALDSVEWNGALSAWQCDEDTSAKSVLNRKAAIGWPGAGEDLMRRILGASPTANMMNYANKMADHTALPLETVIFAFDQFFLTGVSPARMGTFIAASLDVASEAADQEDGFRRASVSLAEFERTKRASEQILDGLHLGPDDFRALSRFKSMSPERLAAVIDRGVFDEADILNAIAGADGQLGDRWERTHPQK